MADHMTDAELIELVQQKGPDELTDDEIDELRTRLKYSSELQSALVGQLQFEECLATQLGQVQISAEQIRLTAAAVVDSPSNRNAALFGWAFCFTAGLFVLAALILTTSRSAPVVEQRRVVAKSGKTSAPRTARKPARSQPPSTRAAADAEVADSEVAAAEQPVPDEAASATPDAGTGPRPQKPQRPVVLSRKIEEQLAAARARRRETGRPADAMPAEDGAGRGQAEAAGAIPVVRSPDPEQWPELARQGVDARPLDAAFDDLGVQRGGLDQNEFKRWLAPVAGHAHRIYQATRGNVLATGFDGLLQLKAAWPADGVLRLAPFEHDGLVLYFWNGEQGVSLHYYHNQRQAWAAYRTSRHGKEPRPITLALVATDNGRYERSFAGPMEIRHQAGNLVVSRGDVRLLSAPLASPPSEVYFERRAMFRTLTMYRGEPLPEDAPGENPAPAPNVLASELPARLAWSEIATPGAEFSSREDQAVMLRTDKSAPFTTVSVPIERAGLYEVIFHVEGASPGTGVFLGDAQGKPLYLVSFYRDRRTGWTTFGFQRPAGENGLDSNFDVNTQITPFTGEQQWVRMVAGSGTIKVWTSGDGLNWSRAFEPLHGQRGGYSQIGLFSIRSDGPKQIVLKQVQVRELSALSRLAPADLQARVPEAVLTHDLPAGAWLTRVIENQPPAADPAAWRRACALRTLATVPPAQFGNLLLTGLMEEQLKQPDPGNDTSLRILDQAALLWEAWDFSESVKLSLLYERLGIGLVSQGEAHPYSRVGQALITAPIWTSAQFQVMPESLVRVELLNLVYGGEWSAVRAFCQRIRFWNQPAHPELRWPDHRLRIRQLVDWADANAARFVAEKRPGEGGPILPSQWKHPLMVDLSKEGFNTLAEVEVALSEESYDDACQIISSAKPDLALGLLPDGRDSQLLVSLPQAVAAAMRDYPALRRTMNENFGKLGRLRVQQAITEVNPLALKAATVQFYGTEAASDAHVWMGDRNLAAGDFARAIAAYQLGMQSAGEDQQSQLAARLRLTAAMLGRDQGTPAVKPVTFRETRLAAAEFEQLVAEMKQKALGNGAAPFAIAETAAPAETALKPVRYDVQQRGRWQADAGQNAGNLSTPNIDWVARQLAALVVGDVLYVNNRFAAAAYDLPAGQLKWMQALGGEQGETHRWPLVSMRPVVAGDRIFVRRLTRNGPQICCLESATGKVLWHTRPEDQVASNPLLVQDELFAFTVSMAQEGVLQLELASYNPQTGEALSHRPLVRLRDAWERQLACSAVAVGGRLIATAGGCVLCCDLGGQPLWVRRQVWIPTTQEPAAIDQQPLSPIVAGGRIYVLQRGVAGVECLDLEGGRRVWHEALPDARRILGLAGERLLVETASGVLALESDTGRRLWTRDVAQPLDAHLCPGSGNLLLTHREPFQGDTWQPMLCWVDPATGQDTGAWPLEKLADKQPMLGPFVMHGDRLWAFFGRGNRDAMRDLVELTPTGAAPYPGQPADAALDRWASLDTPPKVHWAAALLMPGWACLGGTADPRVGMRPEFQGQQELCVTAALRDRPVAFVRQVTLPAGSHPRLVVLAGHEPSEKWKQDIRINGQSVQTQAIETQTTSNGWKEIQADLTPYAGKTIWIVVEQQTEGNVTLGCWKRLDVLF